MKIADIVGDPRNLLTDPSTLPADKLPTNLDVLKHLSSIRALTTGRHTLMYWYNACATDLIKFYQQRNKPNIVLMKNIVQ